ncbi:MAG: hypothetical protein ACTS3T_20570 [Almyronema sp.]
MHLSTELNGLVSRELNLSLPAPQVIWGYQPAWALKTAQVPSAADNTSTQDPLIDRNGELIIYFGIAILALMVGLILRVLSKRVEYLLLFAITLSLILMLLMLTL